MNQFQFEDFRILELLIEKIIWKIMLTKVFLSISGIYMNHKNLNKIICGVHALILKTSRILSHISSSKDQSKSTIQLSIIAEMKCLIDRLVKPLTRVVYGF